MTQDFRISIGNATLAGEQHGQGQPIVCLHAGVTDRRMWQAQAALAQQYRLVSYDRRGFGQTTAGNTPFRHVDDLLAVLDHCGIETAILLGASQGGLVAIDFARLHPQRVAAIVLIAPAVSGAPRASSFPPSIQTQLNALEAADEQGDLLQVNQLETRLWLDGPTSMTGRVHGPLRDLFMEMNGTALSYGDLAGEREPPAAWEHLSELTAPALLLYGSLDFPHIRQRCIDMARRVPRAECVEIPNTAHLPSMETPDRINQLITEFLARPGITTE